MPFTKKAQLRIPSLIGSPRPSPERADSTEPRLRRFFGSAGIHDAGLGKSPKLLLLLPPLLMLFTMNAPPGIQSLIGSPRPNPERADSTEPRLRRLFGSAEKHDAGLGKRPRLKKSSERSARVKSFHRNENQRGRIGSDPQRANNCELSIHRDRPSPASVFGNRTILPLAL